MSGSAMKSKRTKCVPFLERLTPEQLAEFRRGMAAVRRKFQRRMMRRQNDTPQRMARPFASATYAGGDGSQEDKR